jgi:hypothetical protein
MHPPPLSIFPGFLLPFSFNRDIMSKCSKGMSYFMFWLENIFFIVMFSVFELAISPFAYGKIWFNLLAMLRNTDISTIGRAKSAFYSLVWLFLGPFIMMRILLRDVFNFVRILCHHDGFIPT